MDLQVQLEHVWKECCDVIEVQNRRSHQLTQLIESKDIALISSIKGSAELLDSLELDLKEGFKEIFQQLSREILDIYVDSRRHLMESVSEETAKFNDLLTERKHFELDDVVQNLVRQEKVSIKEELDLIDSHTRIEYQEVSKLQQSIRDEEAKLEENKGAELKKAHVVEFGTELLKYKLNQDKIELRKLKRDAIKIHSMRNAMRESVKLAESESEAANRKLNIELQRLRVTKAHLTQKLADIEKINASKYARILKSNEDEIRILSDELNESVKDLVRSMTGGEYVIEERSLTLPADLHDDERWRILSEPIPASEIKDLTEIVAIMEEHLRLRQRQHELADKFHAKRTITYKKDFVTLQ